MPTQRLVYIDLAKAIAIYLVILGHVLIKLFNVSQNNDILLQTIYEFHMPLFMIMSGFFFKSSLKLSVFDFLKKKSIQLLLPSLSCTLICILYLYISHGACDWRVELIGNSWFLKTLFLNYLVTYFLMKIRFPDILLFVVSWVVILLIPHSYSLQFNWMYMYFWMGIFINKYRTQIEDRAKVIFSITIVSFVLLLIYKNYNGYDTDILPMSALLISQIPLLLLKLGLGLTGSLSVLLLCYIICKNELFKLDRIASYGCYTLGIYVVQTFIIVNLLPDIMQLKNEYDFLHLFSILLSLIIFFICIYIINTLSSIKYLDIFLFGGQYHKIQKNEK